MFPVSVMADRAGVTGGGIGEAATTIAAGTGGPSAASQSSRLRVLLVTATLCTLSLGAFEWTTTPGIPAPVIVFPVTVTPVTVPPGASVATTMPPITGPCGPKTPGDPATVLPLMVPPETPAAGPALYCAYTTPQPP